jgi:hypothetical protein
MAYRFDFTKALGRKVYLGTHATLRFAVYDMSVHQTEEALNAAITAGTAELLDPTGWNLRFVLKRSARTDDPGLIEKASGDGITIDSDDRIVVALEPTDSYDPDASPDVALLPGPYAYAVKRMDSGAESIIAEGALEFLQPAAHG